MYIIVSLHDRVISLQGQLLETEKDKVEQARTFSMKVCPLLGFGWREEKNKMRSG